LGTRYALLQIVRINALFYAKKQNNVKKQTVNRNIDKSETGKLDCDISVGEQTAKVADFRRVQKSV
jgi:hypothetical protein